ncbi:MAG: Group 1 glycosyl transferase [Parcubacteria group bacterium GW2011_GWA2_43_17]|nr:MAG: Group 1 glycosyl transferase [Parcubacteria group bacterium GW2011_GWA2_43_17]KKT93168.1 MAG: Group 1 glycosyl transferase [Parcubacteria group bacterium GW2011_GWF2_45_11]KKT98574.1 MAG: Group 1 glycosyl transferase [Parcubacteria group bacterium GW2011_GWC2_45_15]
MYDKNYSRNRVIIRGLAENGHEVLECQSQATGFKKYGELIRQHRQLKGRYDLMMVGFPGQTVMPLAKMLCRTKIIFDAFSSHYGGYIEDRGYHRKFSLMALNYWLWDWFSVMLADVVLLDTQAHIDYFSRLLKISPARFKRIFVSSDDKVFFPQTKKQPEEKFIVYFHGTYIPLQGVEYIIEAASLLKSESDIEFRLLGKGQTFKKVQGQSEKFKTGNVKFFNPAKYEELPGYMAQADVILGIFGLTKKAGYVIPNKVYEALAMKKPVITRKSKALEELLTDRENVLLANPGDPRDLADKILELKKYKELRIKIEENGYQLFKEKLTPKKVVKGMIDELRIKN